jgi:hypothetical protein
VARFGLILFIAVVALQWATASAFALTCPNTLRVAVMKDGKIAVDGKPATLAELDARLTALEKTKGAVWYYREDSRRAPSPAAETTMRDVLETLVKHKAPVSFSYNADYSDTIDDQGNSSPRTKC